MSSSNVPVIIPVTQRSISVLPGTNSSDLKTCTEGAVLSFQNLSYREKYQSGFPPRRKTFETERLSKVNGIMKPGLNAIMGPQDGSMSLLLDVLAVRKDPRGLSGDILINGTPQPANFKCSSGYVPQPKSKEDRKRTAIAMELIINHQILFLDEPTTGLDSGTAHGVILLLKWMSRQGQTIIFSINRPQYSIFRLFDNLTLVASGKVLYHGPAEDALEYFTLAGYDCEPHNNPADFFLDVINGCSSAVVVNREEEDHGADEHKEFFKKETQVTERLADLYAQSLLYSKTRADLDQLSGEQRVESVPAYKEITCVTFWHQLRWIMWRSIKNYKYFYRVTVIQAIITVTLAVAVGTTFRVLRNDCIEVQSRASFLYMLTVFQCITSVSSGELFVTEGKRFLHEHTSGYYRELPYFLGKLLAELVPRRLMTSILFTFTLYSIAGVKTGVKGFFTTIVTVMMLAYSASSLPLSLGAGENAVAIPTLLVTIYFVFMLFFSGLSLYSGTLMPKLLWIQYFSIPHYGFTALQYNEFWEQNFCPELNTTEISSCQNYVMCTGEEFLTIQGIDLSSWGFWKNHVALAVIMIILLMATYIKLLLFKKKHF